jgi:hypothetical protein
MYEAGSPIDRRNVIHVLSGIPGEGMIKELLVGALSDQSPCQEEDETIEGIPLRVCDEAYNELVSRYDVKNTLRVIGTGHRLVDRDFHVAELRKLLGSDPEKGDRPDRQRKR